MKKSNGYGTFGKPKNQEILNSNPGPGHYEQDAKFSNVKYGFGSSKRQDMAKSSRYENRPGPG